MKFNATGVGLIVFGLALLIIPGVMYNNFTSSGFVNIQPTTSCTQLNCPAYPTVNPCSTQSNCQLQVPSLINPNSPFTYLVDGNLLGFIGSFSSTTSQASNPFIFATCDNQTGAGSYINSFSCNGATFNSNRGDLPLPTFNITSSAGNQSIWYATGIAEANNAALVPTQFTSFTFYGSYFANGTAVPGITQTITCRVFAPNHYCLFQLTAPSQANLSNSLSFLGFIIGIILFILSLGIGFSGQALTVGFSFRSNSQGTRLAQTMGMTLLIFSFSFSEFGSWMSSSLGWGFGSLILFVTFGLIFFGAFSQTTTGTAGT